MTKKRNFPVVIETPTFLSAATEVANHVGEGWMTLKIPNGRRRAHWQGMLRAYFVSLGISAKFTMKKNQALFDTNRKEINVKLEEI